MDGVQLPQGYKATTRRPFTFYHYVPWDPWTNLIDLKRMKGYVALGSTQWFWTHDPWIEDLAVRYSKGQKLSQNFYFDII